MSLAIGHVFVSAAPEGPDATKIRTSNWNAAHALAGVLDIANGGTGSSAGPSAASLTGTTFPAAIVTSSLTSVGVLAALTAAGILTTSVDALATTTTDGLVVQNATLATAAIPVQQSPRVRLRGHAWNTTAVAASNTSDAWVELVPVSGATPTAFARLAFSANGAAPTAASRFDFYASGFMLIPGNANINANGRFNMGWPADGRVTLLNNAATAGVGLDIGTDAVLKVRTRSFGAYATVDALGYSVGGVAGASKAAGPIASLTIVNGIITAAS